MRWNFVEEKIYNWKDVHVASKFRHRGIGHIEVEYEVVHKHDDDFIRDCDTDTVSIDLYCGPRLKRNEKVSKSIARSTAMKMYREFVKHKISNDDVLIVEGRNIQIVDINTGLSIRLSKQAIDKLHTLAWRFL